MTRIGLRRHPRGPITRSFVSCAVDIYRHSQRSRQALSMMLAECCFASLDRPYCGRGDSGISAELRLRQTAQDPEVAGEAFGLGYLDKIADGHTQSFSCSCQQIDLRGGVTSLPMVESASADVGQPREIRQREVPFATNLAQSVGGKAPHHATAHREIPRTPITRHCAGPLPRSSQDASIVRGIVQTPRCTAPLAARRMRVSERCSHLGQQED